jgi:hypothetical protein
MSHEGETFFTSAGCMDGRVQEPILRYGQQKFGVKYADTITEAGLVGLLAKENADPVLLGSIKKKILISLEKHHSRAVVVHGHQECAGNPVEDKQHAEETLTAARVIKSFLSPETLVIPVFVNRNGSNWEVEEL